MKRENNLFEQICSLENLQAADTIARRGKGSQWGIKVHDRNKEADLLELHQQLLDGRFKTSPYTTFKVWEPKEREVYRLPYYPDRILHHAIMNVLEPIFVATFTDDTYSCIKGKGIYAAANAVKRALRDEPGSRYCLKLDIVKFYPSVNHVVLKQLLQRKFKDTRLLELLYGIIDSAPGLPIGNYLSQYLANFYLSYFDHWIKEYKRVKYYYRYADDLVILAATKAELHQLLADIRQYLANKLLLQVKGNYQVFPVQSRGIDFVGYVFFHTHTRIRPRIKKNFARKLAKGASPATIASYNGWLCHANCKHLMKKLLNEKV